MALVAENRSAVSVDFAADPARVTGERVLLAQPVHGWVASGGAAGLEGTVGGLTVLEVDDPGQSFGADYRPPTSWWLWLGGQLVDRRLGLIVATRTAAPHRSEQPRTGELTLDLTELDSGRGEEADRRPEPVEVIAGSGDPP